MKQFLNKIKKALQESNTSCKASEHFIRI